MSPSTGNIDVAGSEIRTINPNEGGDLILADEQTRGTFKNIYAYKGDGDGGVLPSATAPIGNRIWKLQLRDRRWLWARTDPVALVANEVRAGGKNLKFTEIEGTGTDFDGLDANNENLIRMLLQIMGETVAGNVPAFGRPFNVNWTGQPASVLLGELLEDLGLEITLNLKTDLVEIGTPSDEPRHGLPSDSTFLVADMAGESTNPRPAKITVVGGRLMREAVLQATPVIFDPVSGKVSSLGSAPSVYGVSVAELLKGCVLKEPFEGMFIGQPKKRSAAVSSVMKWFKIDTTGQSPDVLPMLRERVEEGDDDKKLQPLAECQHYVESTPTQKQEEVIKTDKKITLHQNITTAVEPPFGYRFDHELGIVKFSKVVGLLADTEVPLSNTEVGGSPDVQVTYAYEERSLGIAGHFTLEEAIPGGSGNFVIEQQDLREEVDKDGNSNIDDITAEAQQLINQAKQQFGITKIERKTWAGAHEIFPDSRITSVEWSMDTGDDGALITAAVFRDSRPVSPRMISKATKKRVESSARATRIRRRDDLRPDDVRRGIGRMANDDVPRTPTDVQDRGLDLINALHRGPIIVRDSSVEGKLHGNNEDFCFGEMEKVYENPHRHKVVRIRPGHKIVHFEADDEWVFCGYKLVKVNSKNGAGFPGTWDVTEVNVGNKPHKVRPVYTAVPWLVGPKFCQDQVSLFNFLADCINALHGGSACPKIEEDPTIVKRNGLMLFDHEGSPFLLAHRNDPPEDDPGGGGPPPPPPGTPTGRTPDNGGDGPKKKIIGTLSGADDAERGGKVIHTPSGTGGPGGDAGDPKIKTTKLSGHTKGTGAVALGACDTYKAGTTIALRNDYSPGRDVTDANTIRTRVKRPTTDTSVKVRLQDSAGNAIELPFDDFCTTPQGLGDAWTERETQVEDLVGLDTTDIARHEVIVEKATDGEHETVVDDTVKMGAKGHYNRIKEYNSHTDPDLTVTGAATATVTSPRSSGAAAVEIFDPAAPPGKTVTVDTTLLKNLRGRNDVQLDIHLTGTATTYAITAKVVDSTLTTHTATASVTIDPSQFSPGQMNAVTIPLTGISEAAKGDMTKIVFDVVETGGMIHTMTMTIDSLRTSPNP